MKATHRTIVELFAYHSFAIGVALRLFIAWLLPLLLDEKLILAGVAYTDIDYYVFTDAAMHVQRGESPYDRHTYRYTPFLAALLALLPPASTGSPTEQGSGAGGALLTGRYLFCLADALCGWLIIKFRQRRRQQLIGIGREIKHEIKHSDYQRSESKEWSDSCKLLLDAGWWLYNPLAINICTRGSAESLMVLLPVLLTIWLCQFSRSSPCLSAALAGACHGLAVHAKLYPIIYTLSFMAAYACAPNAADVSISDQSAITRSPELRRARHPRRTVARVIWFVGQWISKFLQPAPLVFAVSFLFVFVSLTYLAVRWYGSRALEEGLLYHFSRIDHRHNYSMHWYWIYLARAKITQYDPLMDSARSCLSRALMGWLGRLLFLPQILLLVVVSLGIAPSNLCLALFVQTFLFVAHNKVITAQYFTWYLCLLPLCSIDLALTSRVKRASALLLMAIVGWLGSAYCLEMLGAPVHRMVWIQSLLFFAANVNFMSAILCSVSVTAFPVPTITTTNTKDD